MSTIDFLPSAAQYFIMSITIHQYNIQVNDYEYPYVYSQDAEAQEILILLDCSYLVGTMLCRLVVFEDFSDDDSGTAEIEKIYINFGLIGRTAVIKHRFMWRTYDASDEDSYLQDEECLKKHRNAKLIESLSRIKHIIGFRCSDALFMRLFSILLFNKGDPLTKPKVDMYDGLYDSSFTFGKTHIEGVHFKEKCLSFLSTQEIQNHPYK
jgi:hypothetical protein